MESVKTVLLVWFLDGPMDRINLGHYMRGRWIDAPGHVSKSHVPTLMTPSRLFSPPNFLQTVYFVQLYLHSLRLRIGNSIAERFA